MSDPGRQSNYLIHVFFSLDQSTRIHGEVHDKEPPGAPTWHEIGRPQVHGYDLLRVSFLDSLRFISIADEKVARVFEAPREFVEVVNSLKIAEINVDAVCRPFYTLLAMFIVFQTERPLAAAVPPLGLSNKAINDSRWLVRCHSDLFIEI